ncbi:MAG: nucleotide sugar dehydrogenase [Candidatus Aenigmarchaeota archaeon]|nr:nucleotide sugar dehydrogenase [Candidatus Aenigmarchaeota archaeon]
MPIYGCSERETLDKIERREVSVCVVGCGTIGLPLATFLASKGFGVTAFDISKDRVESINANRVRFEYNPILGKALADKKINATTSPEKMKKADVIFVCVPTPLNKEKSIDLSILESASETIAKNLQKGAVVVFESSVAIGSTKKMYKLIERVSGMEAGRDFGVAYCPERYNPTLPTEKMPHVVYGDHKDFEKYTVDNVSRVISAIDGRSMAAAKGLYSSFINAEIKEMSTIEAAEATKLLENIFRDVNLALVNEMAKVLPKLGVDTFEVINGAKTKPFAFLPHYPGTGVGGECIPVDTWYLIKQAEDVGFDTRLMRVTREVNDSMPSHVVELLEDAMREAGRGVEGARVVLLGLSYKKNIADARVTPSNFIIDILESKGAEVSVVDPVMEMVGSKRRLTPMKGAFSGADAVVMATDHDVFRTLDMEKVAGEMRTRVLVDGRAFFKKDDMISVGFVYRAVGKP